MIDTKLTVIEALKQLNLPVIYEHFITEQKEMPCITYKPQADIQGLTGKRLMYGNVNYSIKVWGYTVKDLTSTSIDIDKIMRSIGFIRTNTNEMWVNGLGSLELRYKAKTLEIMEDK